MIMRHGGGYSNNSGGATQPKTGDQYTPLCRKSQYSHTMGAMMSKTRSGHMATKMHYGYINISEDQGGNILGYNPE
jgi:hypothetical protein